MYRLGSANKGHRSQSVAPLFDAIKSRLLDLVIVGQPQVVVGTEIEYRAFAAFHLDLPVLWRIDQEFILVEPALCDRLQLFLI